MQNLRENKGIFCVKLRGISSIMHFIQNFFSFPYLQRHLGFFNTLFPFRTCFKMFYLSWGFIRETTFLLSQGRCKVCVHTALPGLHLWDYTGYVVAVVTITYSLTIDFIFLQEESKSRILGISVSWCNCTAL